MRFREIFQPLKDIPGPRIPRHTLITAWWRYMRDGKCQYCRRPITDDDNAFYIYWGDRRCQGWYCNPGHADANISGILGGTYAHTFY